MEVAAWTEFVPVLVASEQGFFGKRDLSVTPQITPNGAVAIQGIQAGSIQIGSVSVSSLLQATDSGLDLVVVCGGAIASSSDKNYGIVAKAGSGIERPEDLVDKRIGVAGLVARRDWAAKNPDVVKHFREAMGEAVQFTAARPGDAVAVYGKHVKLPPEALASIRINKLDTNVTTQQLELWEGMMRRQGMLRKPLVAARLLAP